MRTRVRVYDCPVNTTPKVSRREVANSDVIVLRHGEKGLWTLWKHSSALPVRSVPFDGLPTDVKSVLARSL
jgi:hypothetical protein